MQGQLGLCTVSLVHLAACSVLQGAVPLGDHAIPYNDIRAVMVLQPDFDEYFEHRNEAPGGSWLGEYLADPRNYSVLVHTAASSYGDAIEVILLPNPHPDPNREFRGGGLHCVVRVPDFERLFCVRMK